MHSSKLVAPVSGEVVTGAMVTGASTEGQVAGATLGATQLRTTQDWHFTTPAASVQYLAYPAPFPKSVSTCATQSSNEPSKSSSNAACSAVSRLRAFRVNCGHASP